MAFSFENLDVYKKAIAFAERIYKTSKNFPVTEIYGLSSQLKRAFVLVCSNIAEGSGRFNKKDFVQYLRIARGSIYECFSLLELSYKQDFIRKVDYEELRLFCNELAKMLNGLISSLKTT